MLDPTRACRVRGISLFAGLATLVVVCGWLNNAGAQEQPPKPGGTQSGFEPRIRQLPERDRQDLDQYLDNVSATDAIVEVVVGQGKLLTLKKPLAREEQDVPFVAVGDPTVVDFEVLDNIHIRITGLRIGVTDFAVLLSDGTTYTLEVQVAADMDILRHRLQAVFESGPEEQRKAKDLQVRQIRDHVIVNGYVRDGVTRKNVINMVRAYLTSVQAGQKTKVKSKQTAEPNDEGPRPVREPAREPGDDPARDGETSPDDSKPDIEAVIPESQVIDLLQLGGEVRDNLMGELEFVLKAQFPMASIQLQRIGQTTLVVDGQARDAREVANIVRVVEDGFNEILAEEHAWNRESETDNGNAPRGNDDSEGVNFNFPETYDNKDKPNDEREIINAGRIINLIQVPGPQQVMLKVEVAELNRTAFRAIGLNFLFKDVDSVIGTRVGNNAATFASLFVPTSNSAATVFGILDDGKFQFILNALRQNQVFKVLAEPTLVAMNGQEASFLAGGSFPVPVPQSGAGGGNPTITVQYKEFGVSLDFKPFILDEDTIRLSVGTEVSSIDRNLGLDLPDFGGVPALNERRASTTVQLKEGKTLAIAGLLQVTLEGNTDRIPGLGDLEYIGPFFSNTDSRKVEKELVVLITPYIVDGMDRHEVPCRPGDMVEEPDDWELYLQNRIEKRNCKPYRATSAWYDTFHIRQRYCKWEEVNVVGPHGYSN